MKLLYDSGIKQEKLFLSVKCFAANLAVVSLNLVQKVNGKTYVVKSELWSWEFDFADFHLSLGFSLDNVERLLDFFVQKWSDILDIESRAKQLKKMKKQ